AHGAVRSGIAAGRHGKLGEAGAGESGIGKSLQGDAVIGAAEPRAPKGGERRAGLRRVVDRVAGNARSGRSDALRFAIDMGTIEHRILPRRAASLRRARKLMANRPLWRGRDRFLAIGGPRNEHLVNQIYRNCETSVARL